MKNKIFENIRLLLMDVDGVLTDGKLTYTGADTESKTFNTKDGFGLKMLKNAGIQLGIVTGRRSAALDRRTREIGFDIFFDGVEKKGDIFDAVLAQTGFRPEEIAYIGDDIPDISLMNKVGIAIAVADAEPAVRSCAAVITQRPGGNGAVREICDVILEAKGLWAEMVKQWE